VRHENPKTGAWIEPLDAGSDAAFERLMKPRTGKADAHVHLDFDERYEILEGTATVVREGQEIRLSPGDTLEIPRGTRHVNPHNATSEDLRFRHTASPRTEFADAFVSALAHHMENGTVNEQGEFPDLQLFATLHGTKAKSYLAKVPIVLQKPVIPVAAFIARRRGYRPRYD
jgi:mannose-6-phosphate isomerase-like protein (cupin superfamily)